MILSFFYHVCTDTAATISHRGGRSEMSNI